MSPAKTGFVAIKWLNTHSLSVVIIDDDPDIARLVGTCLRRSGCSLNATLKGKEGLAFVRKINPDVILCDADMPDLAGAQVIETLKSDPAIAHIPVILMTGFAGPEMFTHVPWTGFLSKPFSPSELIAALHHAVASQVRESTKQGNPTDGALGNLKRERRGNNLKQIASSYATRVVESYDQRHL